MVQGSPKAGKGFSVGIHPDSIELDAEVARGGGLAKAGQDDVIVVGPKNLVFPAIERFSQNLGIRCGLSLQRSKCQVLSLSDNIEGIPPDMDIAGCMTGGIFSPGLEVYGCPIGSKTFVEGWLQLKLDELPIRKKRPVDYQKQISRHYE